MCRHIRRRLRNQRAGISGLSDPDNALPIVFFKDIHDISQKTVDKKEKSKLFLQNVVRYPVKSVRINLAKSLYGTFKKEKTISIHQMIEIISKELPDTPKISIRKYLMACATGQVFRFSNKNELGPVFNRVQVLNERITGSDMIDEIYQFCQFHPNNILCPDRRCSGFTINIWSLGGLQKNFLSQETIKIPMSKRLKTNEKSLFKMIENI
jgi:hypothetical protein